MIVFRTYSSRFSVKFEEILEVGNLTEKVRELTSWTLTNFRPI